MNTWFDLLPSDSDVEVVAPGHLLHIFAGKLQPTKVLRGMDFPDEFNPKSLRLFRKQLLERVGCEQSRKGIGVIDRATSNHFHDSAASESPTSGAARRSVPNLAAWGHDRASSIEINIFEPEHLTPAQQVQRAAETSILIGQHGAGLSLMVFMEPGSSIIEIQPPLPAESRTIFRNLALACGHSYHQVPQEGLHSEVDISRLDENLQHALAAADWES